MKICIITVYNSLNYGSYLQSFALEQILKQYSNNVCFLDTKARKPLNETIYLGIKKMIYFNLKNVSFLFKKYICFKKAVNLFSICNDNFMLNQQEIFIFGSDEIWNISREKFRNYPIFLGIGIPDGYWVAYAVSINTTELKQIKESKYFIEAMKKFNEIGVRDKYTLNILKTITSKEISLVLDPTFLLNKETYNKLEEPLYKEEKYILVYSYGHNMNKERVQQIKLLGKFKKMKLISVGFYLDWCDENVAVSPFLFLSYIKNASYIITDTFHGTVFSMIYNKQFVSYGGTNIKILEILKQFKLEIRNVHDKTVLKDVFETIIKYNEVNELINKYQEESLQYIQNFFRKYNEINRKN